MNLFADYVQPLTSWLQANPHWSLFITFFIALTESLAIIGSIVPGSVTMTAIGILAGSGIMRIDLTLIAATLGAVFGDSLSYFLGYFYSDRLIEIWPFKKYPNLLRYGKDFFSKHGGKSVLIGRFVGPLRSIIPVIAGIMHMKQWRFLIANIISAIGWSFLYVMPGVLIGAAGHELSTEGATRLFMLILVIMAVAWLASIVIKSLFIRLNIFLKNNLHGLWLSSKSHSKLARLFNAITPAEEQDHYPTAGLLLLTVFFVICFLILLTLAIKTQFLNNINLPIHIFTQSLHSSLLEALFIGLNQLTSTFTICGLFIVSCIWLIYHKKLKVAIYLGSLLLCSAIVSLLLSHVHYTPRPQGLLVTMPGSSFPAINLVLCTAFYGFIILFVNTNSILTNTFRTIILIILTLSGFASIYLGDYWFTDVIAAYLVGIIICLIHWIIYRKSYYISINSDKVDSAGIMITVVLSILIFSSISTSLNFKTLIHDHAPYHTEFTLTENAWWNQLNPILPLYRLNRIGHRTSLLNIQYTGSLDLLVTSLEQYGWQLRTESFFAKLLLRMNKSPGEVKLPLLAQLYENKRPAIFMTYQDKKSSLVLELTIWESNYFINNFNNPIWIGTVHQNVRIKNPNNKTQSANNLINPLPYIMPALDNFTLRRMAVPTDMIRTCTYPTSPYILLIKKSNTSY